LQADYPIKDVKALKEQWW